MLARHSLESVMGQNLILLFFYRTVSQKVHHIVKKGKKKKKLHCSLGWLWEMEILIQTHACKRTKRTKTTWVLQQQQGCYDITNHYNNDSGTIKSVKKNHCSRRYTYGVRVRVFPVEAIMKLGFCFPILWCSQTHNPFTKKIF
jgi:hypothetical protein